MGLGGNPALNAAVEPLELLGVYNGIYAELVAGIPTQYRDWRGGTRRKKWEGGEGRAPPQSSDLEALGCSRAVTEDPSASGRGWDSGCLPAKLIPIFPAS